MLARGNFACAALRIAASSALATALPVSSTTAHRENNRFSIIWSLVVVDRGAQRVAYEQRFQRGQAIGQIQAQVADPGKRRAGVVEEALQTMRCGGHGQD